MASPPPRRENEETEAEAPSEQTPLLPPNNAEVHDDRSQPHRRLSARRSLLTSLHSNGGSGSEEKGVRRRWPSILALAILSVTVVLIIIFAFMAPSTVEQYAQQAALFHPTNLSIAGFTDTGVQARVQGDFMLDASRVRRKVVRRLGRFFTGIAREAESGESEVEVSLPELGNLVLGLAHLPGLKVDLRSGHRTHVDFISDLQPGDVEGIRRVANDWVDGRLGQLRVLGKAKVPLKSGIISLGKQTVQREILFKDDDIPAIPKYDLKKVNIREVSPPAGRTGVAADVSLVVQNDYPVDFTVPSLAFNILVDNCQKDDPYIKLADAETHEVHIQPKTGVKLNVTGVVHQLPHLLTQDCPGTSKSPLDVILGKYIHGMENTIYVQGSSSSQHHTPHWVNDLISGITVPVPLPGKSFGHLIKNFSLTDTHFSLPDPFSGMDDPKVDPSISAKVRALVALPEEMNFNVSVSRVRADADIFYRGQKLGKLDLRHWQSAKSTRIDRRDEAPTLVVESAVKDAPIHITDEDVFTDVIQDLIFGGKEVIMGIKADVDVEVATALGEVTVRKIPAEGQVPVQPFHGQPGKGNDTHPGNPFSGFQPEVYDLQILATSPTGLTLCALVNVTNPTVYSATIPYIDVHIISNGSVLGHATARDLALKPGNNTNLLVKAVYDPPTMGGKNGTAVGRELLSQYISGYNTTLTLRLHEGSLPTLPRLGAALSKFSVEFPTPRLGGPAKEKGKKDGPHFIEDAVMHLLTSTATFTLLSPLKHEIMYVTSVNATAYHKGDDVGHIEYDLPFAVPPVGEDGRGVTTPRLPVDWSLGSVGYDAVKRALGGRLKLSAYAEVGVRLGRWEQNVWFRGREIGASVRI